eukprot:EG_transcript_29326
MSADDITFLRTHQVPEIVNALMEEMLSDRPEDIYEWLQNWAAGKCAGPDTARSMTTKVFEDLLTPCKWTREEHGTDIAEVDHQHVKLFKLINQLISVVHDHMNSDSPLSSKVPTEQILPIAQELCDYTQYHFSEEEKHFLLTAYPGKDDHVMKHRAFEARMARFLTSVEEGKIPPAEIVKTLKFLKQWLVTHIQQTDREYLEYLPSKMRVYDN